MKQKHYILYTVAAALVSLVLMSSCTKFLDVMPDNRAELDSADKIKKLLTSAYPTRSYVRMCELASDNCDDAGENSDAGKSSNMLMEQNSYWEDMTPADNDSNVNTWQQYYNAIGVANTALQAIEDLGTPTELLPAKGEALMCRAYCHLCLTMLYCLPYHPEKSKEYMGVPYMEAPETELNPEYHRGNLYDVYEKINRDIEEALPLINDSNYSVPKYHFNVNAAYALAARFNLYYMKWDKVVEYASKVLGSDPSILLRDWAYVKANLPFSSLDRGRDYIDPNHQFNLMLIPLYGATANLFNQAYGDGARFAHNSRVAKMETFRAKRPMGGVFGFGNTNDKSEEIYRHPPFPALSNTNDKIYMPKWVAQWEMLDPVTFVGYLRCTMVAFTTNEVLLNRAEAYIHLKEYDAAIADLETWNQSYFRVGENNVVSLTRERVAEVYGNPLSKNYIAEYTTTAPTSRKPLKPHGFMVEEGEQENMIQCALYCRRIETIGDGLRLQDVKRYGMVIDRFDDTNYDDYNGTGFVLAQTLSDTDLRRALQIPAETISAGLEPNPRNEDAPTHPFRQ